MISICHLYHNYQQALLYTKSHICNNSNTELKKNYFHNQSSPLTINSRIFFVYFLIHCIYKLFRCLVRCVLAVLLMGREREGETLRDIDVFTVHVIDIDGVIMRRLERER